MNTTGLTRVVASAATAVLSITGLAVVTAPATALVAAAPSPAVVYDSVPGTLAPSYVSLGYAATSTSEFGDLVSLAGTDRALTSATISLTDWACESDFTPDGDGWTPAGGTCVTTPGTSFTHPITLNFYDVDDSVLPAIVGDLITSVTKDAVIPFRPSAAEPGECPSASQWKSESGTCQNGFAFTVDFDLSGAPVVADEVLVTVAYDTNTHGADPIGEPGPYDSLNVSIAGEVAAVGTDVDNDLMFLDSTWAGAYGDGGTGGTGTLREDSGWTGYYGLILELEADNDQIVTPSTVEKVRQKDVKPNETGATYQSWHEGKNNATPAYSVHPDGLHLGDGAASTIIKGTGVVDSAVTESQLRALLATASVEVTSGSVTFQVPIHFGTSPADHFTTLRSTSLTAGVHTFSLSDTWATTRAFGGYTVQEEAPLGELLNAIFSSADTVWLAGVGVQADAPAVVPTLSFATSIYEFEQPEVAVTCSDPANAPVATDAVLGGWTFGQTRTLGSNTFVEGGLKATTVGDDEGDPSSQSKAAGYLPVDFALADAGPIDMQLDDVSGSMPGVNLGVDLDNDGTQDGYLVYEPSFYGQNLWASNGIVNHDPAFVGLPTVAGGGSAINGTLNAYLIAYPDARVMQFGYSLGSGAIGSVVITSLTAGCVTHTFDKFVAPSDPTFADVPSTATFYNEIEWAAAAGITTGSPQLTGKSLFKPVDDVSRQAMAAFLYRLSHDTFAAPVEPTFADVTSANQFYTAIEWMAAEGISTGTPQESGKPLFKPVDAVSRQAMALFLSRYAGATVTTPTEQSFADVPIESDPAPAIAWMAEHGISTGTANPPGLPLYKPADPVSRQAMAAFISRLAHKHWQ